MGTGTLGDWRPVRLPSREPPTGQGLQGPFTVTYGNVRQLKTYSPDDAAFFGQQLFLGQDVLGLEGFDCGAQV